MKERPILFSAPMVRALLAGSKTQTRRVLKQATGLSLSVCMDEAAPGVAALSWLHGDGPGHDVHEHIERVRCPYGQPGDRLWVREAWGLWQQPFDHESHDVVYRADVDRPEPKRWRPSIHMPRWASRILLEVTDVRVERLQDISEADAIAEGIVPFGDGGFVSDDDGRCYGATARQSYAYLWESINGADSWAANPWAWVVSFRNVRD